MTKRPMNSNNLKYLAETISSLKTARYNLNQLLYDFRNDYTIESISEIESALESLETFLLETLKNNENN